MKLSPFLPNKFGIDVVVAVVVVLVVVVVVVLPQHVTESKPTIFPSSLAAGFVPFAATFIVSLPPFQRNNFLD